MRGDVFASSATMRGDVSASSATMRGDVFASYASSCCIVQCGGLSRRVRGGEEREGEVHQRCRAMSEWLRAPTLLRMPSFNSSGGMCVTAQSEQRHRLVASEVSTRLLPSS
jgi:hypothetical protein